MKTTTYLQRKCVHTLDHWHRLNVSRLACRLKPVVCWVDFLFNHHTRKLVETQSHWRRIKVFPKVFRGQENIILLSWCLVLFLKNALALLEYIIWQSNSSSAPKRTAFGILVELSRVYILCQCCTLAAASNCWEHILCVVTAVWKRVMMPSVEMVPSGTEQMPASD